MLTDYFLKHHASQLTEILNAHQDLHYSIDVNFASLFEADAENANKILHRPREFLPLCDESIVKAQELMVSLEQTVKRRVQTRITAVPVNINQGQIGELVSTTGVTIRISQPTVLKLAKRFECRKCSHVTVVKVEWERQIFPEVKECGACRAKSISVLSSPQQEDCADYQEIKIQEKCQTDTSDSYTLGLQVILMNDLVDKCRPGDHVDVSGIMIRRWCPLAEGRRMMSSTIMMANSVSVRRQISESKFSSTEIKDIFTNYWGKYDKKNALLGRDNIVASICPQIFGMYLVKLALAVVLAGGVPKTNETGSRVRAEPHLLLIGDPGTGKSQLLRAASRLAVRSILTTGIGTTAAGLTAAAVKDTDGWHLEGGALVLADDGVCCVDEFTTMNSQDRASLHEAMKQQTISIAKAGLVSTLHSRCTVVAAINPVGGKLVDGEEMKTRLGNPLLSRFDLILLLKDNNNPEWDRMTSHHILNAACQQFDKSSMTESKKHMDLLKSEGLWKEDSLREYLAHVHSLKPVRTPYAEKIISAVFLYHRSNPHRLSEGHARLMYRSQVSIVDAVVAAQLIGTHPDLSTNLGSPFPVDPTATFSHQATELLERLGLESLITSL